MICRVSRSMPNPQPSTPALLEMTVMPETPELRIASIKFAGMPQSPNPPDMMVIPFLSKPASALAAPEYVFLIDDFPSDQDQRREAALVI
ncbi:protein of unknown function [Hyphomicrobium sp. MC1]|nr:protein of unknown function [Hyphomicrobium sp. MC1]